MYEVERLTAALAKCEEERDEARRTVLWVNAEYGRLPVAVTMNDRIRDEMRRIAVEEYGPAAADELFPEKG